VLSYTVLISLDKDLSKLMMTIIFLQYVGDEEFGETIKSYSSVKKEQTMFTDTHL